MEAQQQENTRLPVLKEQLRDTEKRLANLLEAIEQGILTPTTKQRLDELEARKEALNTSILEEELKKPVLTREWIRFWFEKFRKGDMRDMEHQRQIIDTFVTMPIMVLPVLSTIIGGLLMMTLIGKPIAWLQEALILSLIHI